LGKKSYKLCKKTCQKTCLKCGQKSATKNGSVGGKNKFKCFSCFYQWIEKRGKQINYQNYYSEYLLKRRTLSDIASHLQISTRTLCRKFDVLNFKQIKTLKHHHANLAVQTSFDNKSSITTASTAINLVLDATYFGREYGFFCFSDGKNIIYSREIKTEGVKVFKECLAHLQNNLNYRFQSFVLDGKRGFINNIKKLYPNKPIQMCHFHQKMIVRRYITDNPRTKCAQELKGLVDHLSIIDPQEFIDKFFVLKEKYNFFLRQKNEKNINRFKHQAIRSAFASINYHLEYLFTYKEHPNLQIPNTTNDLEGKFAHLKERVKIHRGMTKNRKKKAVEFLLGNYGQK
jgi:hypothetical protein